MDVASTVFSLTTGIVKFIAEHGDKDAMTEQISNIAIQIQTVITPLRLHPIPSEAPVIVVLGTLQDVVGTVDGHLRSWRESKARRAWALVNPWAVTAELKEDREQLMHQYMMLMGAMQVEDYLRGYKLHPSAPDKSTSMIEPRGAEAEGNEVQRFWHSHFGSDVDIVKSSVFCDHISTLPGLKLGKVNRARLLLRLDENETGNVTFSTLQDLVKSQNTETVLRSYIDNPSLPLLVWVDDDILGNKQKLKYAYGCGVTVIQLSSTKIAKKWLNINRDFLEKYDNARDLRFISDQVRMEIGANGKPFKNWRAGDEITRFIRSEAGFKAPILIWTGKKSLHVTNSSADSDSPPFDKPKARSTRKNMKKLWLSLSPSALSSAQSLTLANNEPPPSVLSPVIRPERQRRPSVASQPTMNPTATLLHRKEEDGGSPNVPYSDGPVQVIPGIWIGDEDNARDWKGLIERGIHSILNVAKEVSSPFDANPSSQLRPAASTPNFRDCRHPDPTYHPLHVPSGRPAMHYLKLPWSHGQQDLVNNGFKAGMAFADAALRRGEGCLIHCESGISRSAAMAIALVMRAAAEHHTSVPPEVWALKGMQDAYSFVKEKSPCVGTNMSLIYQLLEYEKKLQEDKDGSPPNAGSGAGDHGLCQSDVAALG